MGKAGGRNFTLTLEPVLDRQLLQFMHDSNLASKPDAVRQILWERLASTQVDGALVAAQARAFAEVRRWILGRVAQNFHEISVELARARDESDQPRRASGN